MTIQISPEVRNFIDEQLQSGRYPDTDTLLKDAITALEARQTHESKRAELIREIELGEADFEAGRYDVMTDELMDSIRKEARLTLGIQE
jgi:putative addiction module CopG family antidote